MHPFRYYRSAKVVTPHDTNGNVFDSLWVGVTGNLAIQTAQGDDITIVAVPAGTLLPIQVKLVKATGTTATSILGLV